MVAYHESDKKIGKFKVAAPKKARNSNIFIKRKKKCILPIYIPSHIHTYIHIYYNKEIIVRNLGKEAEKKIN